MRHHPVGEELHVLEASAEVHAGPHHSEAAVGHAQFAQLFYFADAVLGVADYEAVLGQFGKG